MTTHKVPAHLAETVKKAVQDREDTLFSAVAARDNATAFAARRKERVIAQAGERYEADVKLFTERCESAKETIERKYRQTLDRVRDAMGVPGLATAEFVITDGGEVEISTEE